MDEQTVLLRTIIVRLAENKSALGQRYAEWGASASSPESGSAVTDMALDEYNQATMLYRLIDAGVQRDKDAFPEARSTPTPFLRAPLRSWLDLIAANFLFDSAMTIICFAIRDSSYAPLAEVARAIVSEEQIHMAYGDGWVRRLGGEGGPMAQGITEALRHIWDEVLCWLGPQHDPIAEMLYAGKITDAMPNVLRARLLAQIGPAISTAKLRLPLRSPTHGNAWELTEPLPWERWNDERWQLDPVGGDHPAE
jgi:ring-1,2-phenylacetyl-CoA epoxidase subunit PaaC